MAFLRCCPKLNDDLPMLVWIEFVQDARASLFFLGNGTRTATVVPLPCSEWIENSPCTNRTRSFMLMIPRPCPADPVLELNPTPSSWM
jgi:hypothetical protein